jgi:putative PIN family toxin of toxin-antitoxin system
LPLTPEIIAGYEKAHYVVLPDLVFRVARRSAELEALLDAEGALTAAFVTPANPHSERRSAQENRQAQAELEASLGYPFRRAEGRDPEGQWPAEPGVLVLGIARGEAEALGRALGQNAIVWVEKGRPPELALLAKMRLVLDTQVWLDWLVFDDPSTAPLRALLAADRAEIFIDEACEEELRRVLGYPLGRRTLDAAAREAALDRCRGVAKKVQTAAGAKGLPACRDPDDQKLLELALAARADCLVTRDRALLELRRCPFRILAPGELSGGAPRGTSRSRRRS